MKSDKLQTIARLRAAMDTVQSGGSSYDGLADPGMEARGHWRHAEGADDAEDAEEAFACVVRYCAHRDRSALEVEHKLVDEDFSQDGVDAALKRALACGLVDDVRFADAFIRARVRAGRGIKGIEYDLQQKGVNPSGVPGWPADYVDSSHEGQVKAAVAFLNKRPSRSKNQLQSAYRRLVQRGFSASVASAAARQWCGSDFM